MFHKTATSLAEKQRYMPLVALLQGSTGMDWSKFRIESYAGADCGYQLCTFWGKSAGPPSQGGELCTRLRTSEEIGALINRLLKNALGQFNRFKQFSSIPRWFGAVLMAWMNHPTHCWDIMNFRAQDRWQFTREICWHGPLQLYCSMLSNIREVRARPDESHMSRLMDLMKIFRKCCWNG